jgi:glycosyltransferase involved in cell wall biosynthesis
VDIYYDQIIEKAPFLLRSYLHRMTRRHKPDVIMAPVPEVRYFVEAYKTAKRHGIPFYAHMHDLWQENYEPGSFKRALADKWEKEILTNATRVLCMTQVQKEHYEKKYGIQCELMPHTITKEIMEAAPTKANDSDKRTVLFTGAVSTHMNLDALSVLTKASTLVKSPHTLLCCTTWKKEDFETRGMYAPGMEVKYVSRAEVQKIQSAAAVLVAPLSHKNGAMDEVRTVFSTKLLEYMVSGRPILIFAPADSFHAISATQNGWGYVVSEDSPEALAAGIDKLLNDEVLCSQLVLKALAEAKRRLALPYSRQLHEWVISDSRA